MNKCKYCKDLNDEKSDMEISQIVINGSYYDYEVPIKFCPNCGKVLKKYVLKSK